MMTATSSVVEMDMNGTVSIPKYLRKKLRWNLGDQFVIYVDDDAKTIMLRKRKLSGVELKTACEKIVSQYRSTIEQVNFADNVTTIVTTSGRTGNAKWNPLDEFDMNVAIAYALKDAGMQVDI